MLENLQVLVRTLTLETSSSGRQMADLRTGEKQLKSQTIAKLKLYNHDKVYLIHAQKQATVLSALCLQSQCFTLSSLSAQTLSPVTHIARCHQREDDGHKQETHSS